jgi:polyhydroxyalkanoate synthesis regulator protein
MHKPLIDRKRQEKKMLNIKKYANGRFFDTATKKYIKPEKLAELIKKGERIQVTLTKTGKDITNTVVAQFSKKEEKKKESTKKEGKKKEIPFLKTDKLVKWLGDIIDTKIEKVMEVVKLPTREQVANLDENIKKLNKKIDALTLSQVKAENKKAAAPKKTSAAPKTPASKETSKETPSDKNRAEDKPADENRPETKPV